MASGLNQSNSREESKTRVQVYQRRKKMSQVIGLCDDSDDNEEWPNTASVPSLPVSRKRPRDREESSTDAHPHNENGPGKNIATGSAEFAVDLELADELEVSVSPHRKRRDVMKSESSVKNDAAGNCAQSLEGVKATEKDVGSEDTQVAGHRESHEGIEAAASHPMNSDSKQTSQDDGSANKHSQKAPTSKPPSHASGRQWRVSPWEYRLSELADYRKINGHCNVPHNYSENTKMFNWVNNQRSQYRLHVNRKKTSMTLSRIQELESIGFEWDSHGATWEDRLSELADYRKIHGHCNVPKNYREKSKLANWVSYQRSHHKLHREGKRSQITLPRIQALERLGFEWKLSIRRGAESQLETAPSNEILRDTGYHCPGNKTATGSAEFVVVLEIADEVEVSRLNRKQGGVGVGAVKRHRSAKNDAAGNCAQSLEGVKATEKDVGSEDTQVAGHRESHEGIAAAASHPMNSDSKQRSRDDGSTNTHSQKLSTMKPPSNASGRQWRVSAWEERLSELADYRKIHGHCNVPQKYSENNNLGTWVATQRYQYRLHLEGKRSQQMTLPRIQALESLGFEWGVCVTHPAWEDRLSELADYRKIHGHCNVPYNYSDNTKLGMWV
jgi:hypothetical protein